MIWDSVLLITLVSVSLIIAGSILLHGNTRKAMAALSESEKRFRGFVESTMDWVWEIDASGRNVYSNDRVKDLLGYDASELDGMHWHDLVHPDDLAEADAIFRDLSRKKRAWERWLMRIRHKDGSFRYLESSAAPILDENDNLLGYRGIDHDSTLIALMTHVSSRLVGSPAAELDSRIDEVLALLGPTYGLDRVSFWWLHGQYAQRSHEWASEGGQGPRTFVDYLQAAPWMTGRLRAGKIVKVTKLDDLPSDLEDRAFLASQGVKSTLVLPLVVEGDMIGVAVFSTVSLEKAWSNVIESELTQVCEKIAAAYSQAQATRQLLRSEGDLIQSETLAHVGSFSYYPLTEGAEFPHEWRAQFSRELCDLLELDPADASFETFVSRVHQDDRQLVLDAAARFFDHESEVCFQYRIVNPSGRLVHIANRTRVDRDGHGRIVRIIGANRDITDQVAREHELQSALREVAQLRDRLEQENIRLRQEVRTIKGFEQIIGDSRPLRQCLDVVSRAAPTDAPVLILGETGTGKELIAKAIHELSLRREKRLVNLNCTALPNELVESELFGHERGAFTGAHQRREGRFEAANGGTLFLDEIADLPLHSQGKLLRVMQDGTFERVGGTDTLEVDVRIIAATNKDLQQAVANGTFRTDLFYRINTVTVQVPPLRKRKEDIPSLVHHFLQKHGPRLNAAVESISAGMLQHLEQRIWQGNVRELENLIERALITARGKVLTLNEYEAPKFAASDWDDDALDGAFDDLASNERKHILRVLAETDWTIGGANGAASRLGLPPSTLRSKMKKHGIHGRHSLPSQKHGAH